MVDRPYVPLTIKACAMAARERVHDLRNAAPPDRRTAADYCRLLRRIGVGLYLITGVPTAMFTFLQKSGRAWLHCQRATTDALRSTGAADPLLDAIAASDFETVAALARLRSPLRPGIEYEEDRLYVLLLQALATDADESTRIREWLDRWHALSPDDPRARACASLGAWDEHGLAKAITESSTIGRARLAAQTAANRVDLDHLATTANVCVETLAWCRLAERRGVRLPDSVPDCPPTALLFHLAPDPQRTDCWDIPIGSDLPAAAGRR